MKPLFLFEQGFLGRSGNTLIFENALIKRRLPIKGFNALFLLNEVSINTKLLTFLARNLIPVFFYNFSGDYIGCFMPFKSKWFSGKLLINQVNHFTDLSKRLFIGKEFIKSSIHNMRKVILKHRLISKAKQLNDLIKEVELVKSVNSLLIIEANARRVYYSCFDELIKNKSFIFSHRSFRPPINEVNALLSFGNALLYGVILSEVFRTQLDSSISFVHEPLDNRYSLQLDLADIFKPLLVDRFIFSLINRRVVNNNHFEQVNGGFYLNKRGRGVFVERFNNYLLETVKIGDKSVSYKQLIRLECHKLVNHFNGVKVFKGFRMWW